MSSFVKGSFLHAMGTGVDLAGRVLPPAYPAPGASPEPPWRHVALSPAVASMAVLCEALAVLLPVVDAIILPRLVEVLELSCRPLGRRDIVLHVRLQSGVEVGIGGDDTRPVGGVCVCVW